MPLCIVNSIVLLAAHPPILDVLGPFVAEKKIIPALSF